MEILKESRPRGIYLLPNLFTVAALFAGFYSIISSLKGNLENAAIAIFIAMIMDSLDGRIARLTNTMTAFGAELDSLSDMVCFAVAPSLLIYSAALGDLGKFGWVIAFLYTVAVALRLARFNTQLATADKRYFQGIPCPAAAGVISSIVLAALDLAIVSRLFSIVLVVITIFMSLLMVSNIRFRSFKDIDFKNHVPFVVILLSVLILVLIIVLISIDPSLALFFIFSAYAISGPVATIWGLHQKKLVRKQSIMKRHEQPKH